MTALRDKQNISLFSLLAVLIPFVIHVILGTSHTRANVVPADTV